MKNKTVAKALKFDWEPWLKRDFFAFIMSIFNGGTSKAAFRKIGLPGWEMISFMFNGGEWYWSEDVYNLTEKQIEKWIKTHKISEITERLDKFYSNKKTRILKLVEEPGTDTKKKLLETLNILKEDSTYIWTAHLLEHCLLTKIKKESKKYIKTNIDKFIGDASYPEKKNKLEQMEDEIRKGTDPKIIAKEYGWMRAREGFARGYTVAEIIDYAKTLKKPNQHLYPAIPKPLKKLISEARELVYFRTRRTDILYEFFFLARPIIEAMAKKYNINFKDLKCYTAHSLVNGRLKKYSKDFGCVSYKENLFFFNKPFKFSSSKTNNSESRTEVKGTIAQTGIVRGTAKVVFKVSELEKVKRGDILITSMTAPNFLQAMKLSAAFVTNEGGLTCHAAIIAREIKKPCIIGTKIATKIFKDGDLIEVDANRGIVKLLKR
jgi:phosphoenolpyruvate synthase/pyruvate phosphate dikinase